MILVAALDGLDPDLLARFRDRGSMPVLDGIARRGLEARLRSTFPACSVPAWSSFLTGVGPGTHGLFDFTRLEEGRVRFQSGADRGTSTLLELADAAGRRVCSIGVPTTYPAPALANGAVLSGFDSPLTGAPDPRAMHPLALWRRLRDEGVDLRLSTLPEGRKGRRWHQRAPRHLAASIARRLDQACRLLREGPWDLLIVHFQAADTAGHHFFRYLDPRSPRHDAGYGDRQRVIPDVYAALDNAVGELLACCGADDLVLVLSDHGMGPASARVFHLNRWLELEGYLRRATARDLRWVAALRRLGLRWLPRAVQTPLFRWLRDGPVAGLESRHRLSGIDLDRSAAFSEESSTLPGVWVRDPRVREALIRRLRRCPAVERVFRREDLYRGALRQRAPDLLLALRHAGLPTPLGYAGPAIRDLRPEDLDGERGAGMNGVHRPDGVLLAAGPGIRIGPLQSRPWIGELAPTLLARLGVAIPDWMECAPLLALAPEGSRCTETDARAIPRAEMSRREEAVVAARLRRLGYLG